MAAWASSRRPAPRSSCATSRIGGIYEGTNGIQAIDLVQRKLPLSGGDAVAPRNRRHARDADAVRRGQRAGFRPHGGASRDGARRTRARHRLHARGDRRRARRRACRRDAVSAAVRSSARRHRPGRDGARRAWRAQAATPIRRMPAASPWRGSLPRTSRRGAGGLERTVTQGAGSVHAAELALAGLKAMTDVTSSIARDDDVLRITLDRPAEEERADRRDVRRHARGARTRPIATMRSAPC